MISLYNADCLEAMKAMPDKAYQLAIVDPPYGIDADKMQMGKGINKRWQNGKNWDSISPDKCYFDELLRVSERQIIWGGNYFQLTPTGGWIYWNKDRKKDISFSDGELAWTNFLTTLREAKIKYDGFLGADTNRIHPTQKPVKLYEWILKNYAKPMDRILDTHLGSGSIAIACHNMGYDLDGFEIDKDYYEAAVKRLDNHKRQGALFTPQEIF